MIKQGIVINQGLRTEMPMEYLLENRKFTLILARDGNPDRIAPPGLIKAWDQAESTLLMIAEKCHHLSLNNLDVYVASNPYYCYENVFPHQLKHIFNHAYAPPEIDLYKPLQVVLNDYFKYRKQGPEYIHGQIIIVAIDCEPPNRKGLIQLLVDTTRKLDQETELGILFAQVGDCLMSKTFLQALDDHLHRAGASFDIVDTKTLLHLNPETVTHFLLGALFD
jgi:hypothetical protein